MQQKLQVSGFGLSITPTQSRKTCQVLGVHKEDITASDFFFFFFSSSGGWGKI